MDGMEQVTTPLACLLGSPPSHVCFAARVLHARSPCPALAGSVIFPLMCRRRCGGGDGAVMWSQVMIGEDTLIRFSGCKAGEACTIVLRGARCDSVPALVGVLGVCNKRSAWKCSGATMARISQPLLRCNFASLTGGGVVVQLRLFLFSVLSLRPISIACW